jgi:hypothetical protein
MLRLAEEEALLWSSSLVVDDNDGDMYTMRGSGDGSIARPLGVEIGLV